MTALYAHTPGPAGWDDLRRHLRDVATMAEVFAEPFGAGELSHWLGLFHDLGKAQPEFRNT
jgi:CRISPR-associated endonuclease/helicase Cas3